MGEEKIRSTGVQQEALFFQSGTGSLLVGARRDPVSSDMIEDEGDRPGPVERRGKERGGRELLGQGKGKPLFFSPSCRRTVVMKRWARKI